MNQSQYPYLSELVVDQVDAMLAYWDEDLVCRFANDAYVAWFGRTKEEMVNKIRLSELLGQTLFEKNLPYILGALGGEKQSFEREIPVPNGNGRVRHSLASYFPHVIDGKVLGFFVHVADVTPIKTLELNLATSNRIIEQQNILLRKDNAIITRQKEELKAALDDISTINEELRASNEELTSLNERLYQANRTIEAQASELRISIQKEKQLTELKDRFVAMVSHEFRTPLSVILVCAEFIRKHKDNAPAQQLDTKLDTVIRNVGFMSNLLNDILEIRKLAEGRIGVNRKPLKLAMFKDLAEEALLSTGSKTQLAVHLKRDDNSVWMDERVLHNIIFNLVVNAVKYSPQGGMVEVTVEGDKNQLVLVVSDSGIGIPEDEIGDLFTSFHRGSNVGNIPGTGLGLTIVKQALDLMNGEIEVRSEVGNGTTFRVTVPLIAEDIN